MVGLEDGEEIMERWEMKMVESGRCQGQVVKGSSELGSVARRGGELKGGGRRKGGRRGTNGRVEVGNVVSLNSVDGDGVVGVHGSETGRDYWCGKSKEEMGGEEGEEGKKEMIGLAREVEKSSSWRWWSPRRCWLLPALSYVSLLYRRDGPAK